MSAKDVKTSKFLSLVLRHEPHKIGIALDEAGWVGVDELLAACQQHAFPLTHEDLARIVRDSDKQRFVFNEDRSRIRANQGHSVEVELGYEPMAPPEVLYHGTAEKYADAIRREGLQRRARHHVHLSETQQTAEAVATRHGKLVMLTVRSGQMHRDGLKFYRTPNGVWLTDEVPVKYLSFPS